MKYSRILLILPLILTCGLVVAAQGQEGGKKRPKHNGKITKEYDQASNQTDLWLHMMPITCVKDGCIFFSLRSSFAGVKPQAPLNRFIFGLFIFTKTLDPFADSTLFLKVDGEAIEVGAMAFAGKTSKDDLTGLPYGIPLNDAQLTKIANARKVEMRIGNLQFTLGEDQINAINDYHRQATTIK